MGRLALEDPVSTRNGDDVGKDIIALADSSSLVCGVTYANGAFSGFLAHLNADGTVDTARHGRRVHDRGPG